jgi:hypothetical protein
VAAVDHGWLTPETAAALKQFFTQNTRIVVELGAWLGRSTRFIAESAPNSVVISVDHWEGSEEHHHDPVTRAMLPSLYDTFLSSCWEHRGKIVPVRLRTIEGLNLIAEVGIQPDLIYIDASHAYEDVRQDLLTAKRLFPTSVIVGDDWYNTEVSRAVRQVVLLGGMERQFGVNGNAWWITPGQL